MSYTLRSTTLRDAIGLCALAGMASVMAPFSAQAQSDAGPNIQEIPEIVVTSRRREEALHTIPESVTVFTGEALENARIRKMDDFLALTSNVEFLPTQSPGSFQISIRGISMASLGEAPVVMVVDGVTLPYPNAFNTPLFDIASVEVLKGPQGALYGQNAIGGAIVVKTNQPTNDFQGKVTGSYGAHDERSLITSVSGPIVEDKLLFRAGYYHNHFGGDVRYAQAPRDKQNYLTENTARVDLKWNMSDDVTFDTGVIYSKTKSGGGTLVPETLSPGSAIPFVSTDDLNNLLVIGEPNQGLHSKTSRSVFSVSGRLVADLGFAELSSVSAYTRVRSKNLQDADVSPIPFVGGTQDQEVDAFSQEVRLTSPNDQRFRWLVTGFYQTTDRDLPQNIQANLNLLTTGDIDPANQIQVPASVLTRAQKLESRAVAAQVNYDLMDTLELTLAGRYDNNPRSQRTTSIAPAAPEEYLKRTFKKFQPKASIAYKPTDDMTYYLTYAEGFRAGGFNVGGANAAVLPAFDAEETETFEAGAKFAFWDRRVTMALAAYTTKYANQQLTLTSVSAGGALSQSVFTVESSRIKGIEADIQVRPAPGLQFGFSGGLQEGKIKQFGNSLSGAAFDPSAYIDNDVPLQSKYTLALTGDYTTPINDSLDAVFHVDFTRKGKLYWYADNVAERKPFNLVNAKVSVAGENWEFGIYGRNIFDVDYNTSYFDNLFVGAPGGFDFGFRGAKARYGAEATFRF